MAHRRSYGRVLESAAEPFPESEDEPGEGSALIDPELLEVTLRSPAAALCWVPPLKVAPLAGVAAVPAAATLDCALDGTAGA